MPLPAPLRPPFAILLERFRADRSENPDIIVTMSSASTISSSTRPMSRDHQYDTGFPDSFAARTTSLRHPDANTSPGACISAEDIDPAKTLHRSRRTLLRKHRRTISHGVITAEAAAEYQNDSAVDVNESKDMLVYDDTFRPASKDSSVSIDRVDSSVKGASSPPSSPAQSSRRRSMFQKWRSQKA
ncbi:hypothetical protein PG990_006200 [Apiospora arundinis]|uniref:Uncharacterized protein n=1 Tax=Apiospora arundinis TaxID=335852 RepID=A0ABR2J9U0_9PEZI